jgi:hypothetical protein
VQVLANDAPIEHQIVRANYVKLSGVRPSTRYTVMFPLAVREMGFRQLRNQDQKSPTTFALAVDDCTAMQLGVRRPVKVC